MKKKIFTILLCTCISVLANSTPENSEKVISSHSLGILPSPPVLAVESYIMLDLQTDTVLASYNEDKIIHPASLTKLMTSYLVSNSIKNGSLSKTDKVTISQKAWRMTGSTMFLEPGQKVSVEQLLKGIIIVSGNDASIAIAEHIAGSEEGFAEMMSKMAMHLGMKNTSFMNASGVPSPNHYSTAKDLALLSKHVILDYPEEFALYSEKYFQFGIDRKTKKPLQEQKNRNRLLWVSPYVDGLKTGHIQDAGYHLAATGQQNDRRLIVVLLGAKNELQRADDVQKLFTYGFNFFSNSKVVSANEILKEAVVWGGKENKVNIGVTDDIVVTIPKGMNDQLNIVVETQKDIEAPIASNTAVGNLTIKLGNKVIKNEVLMTLQPIDKGSWFKVFVDKIKKIIIDLFH